jgi:hypothetical protein
MSAPNGMPMPSPEYLAEDNRSKQRIGMIVVPIITFIVVLVRVYARLIVVRKFGWDDALIIVGFVRRKPHLQAKSRSWTKFSFPGIDYHNYGAQYQSPRFRRWPTSPGNTAGDGHHTV